MEQIIDHLRAHTSCLLMAELPKGIQSPDQENGSFTSNMGSALSFNHSNANLLKHTGLGIQAPTQAQLQYSTNGSTWQTACTVSEQGIEQDSVGLRR